MKLIACLGLFLLTGMSMGLRAQDVKNTSWKTFIGDPLYDSLTIHIRADSSFVTTSSGSVVVRSVCKVAGDTLSLSDYEGQYACPDMTGRYRIKVAEDVLTFLLIDDACDGRATSLNNSKWRRVPEK